MISHYTGKVVDVNAIKVRRSDNKLNTLLGRSGTKHNSSGEPTVATRHRQRTTT